MSVTTPAHPDDDQSPMMGFGLEGLRFEVAPHELFLIAKHTSGQHRVGDGAVVCYLTLCFLGADGNFKIRQNRLGEAMGGRSQSTVKRFLAELLDAGWLLSGPTNRTNGSRSSNRYMILREPLTGPDDPRIAEYREQMRD